MPPAFTQSAKTRNILIYRAGYRAALAHDGAAPHARDWRPSAQFPMGHNVKPLAGLDQIPIAMLSEPSPFFSALRFASGIALGTPFQPEIFWASADKIDHHAISACAVEFGK